MLFETISHEIGHARRVTPFSITVPFMEKENLLSDFAIYHHARGLKEA